MYILVGGMGWVGSWVAKQLVEEGEQVLTIDISRRAHLHWKGMEHAVGFAQASIMDLPELLHIFDQFRGQIKGVVNLSYHMPVSLWHTSSELKAQTDRVGGPGGRRTMDPYKQVMTHVAGTMNLLELCRASNARNFVFISSGAVYSDMEGVWQEDRTKPECLYSSSKRAVEIIGAQYRRDFDIDFKSCRLMHVYGGLLPLSTSHPVHRVFFGPLQGLMEVSSPKGADQMQTMTYIKDIANGICLALKTPYPKHTEFNVAGPELLTTKQIIAVVKATVDLPTVQELGPGCYHPRYRNGGPIDISRAREEIGYVPKYDIRAGIKDYADWIRSVTSES